MDWMLFTGFCFILIIIFLYKSISVYKIYHNTFYEDLYSNFFEFYIKFKYKKNLSQSSWLKNNFGFHRILFNSYLDKEKIVRHQFITIFTSYGINIFYIFNIDGIISGKSDDLYWTVKKNNQFNKTVNPTSLCRSHEKYINTLVNKKMKISTVILFPSKTDFSILKSNIPVASNPNFISIIKENNQEYPNDLILHSYQKCIERK